MRALHGEARTHDAGFFIKAKMASADRVDLLDDSIAVTLQAGRSILVNAAITKTSGGIRGAVSLFANDGLANGVVDA